MTRSFRARAAMPAAVLAAILTIVPGAPSHAGDADSQLSTHDLQIMPVGSGNAPAGSRVAVETDPGASVERSFVLANRTSGLRLTVRLAAVDATAASDGRVTFAKEASASGPASWLTLSDGVATLEPKAELRVALTIAPPGNAEPGSLVAGVVASVDRSVRLADGADGPKSDPVALPVAIEVKGAATALVSIVGVDAVKDHDRSYLELTFQNGGATANTMAGTLKVLGPAPKTFDLRVHVEPLEHTTERVPFAMPSGAKTVPVAVDTQDVAGNQAAWSGRVGFDAAPAHAPTAPKTARPAAAGSAARSHAGLLPRLLTFLVVLAFAAGAVWFGAEVRRSRRSRAPRDPARVRRVRRPKVTPIAIPSVLPDRAAAGRRDAPAAVPATVSTEAVAAQLGALVHAIDRLVSRLGEVFPTAAGRVTPVASPNTEPVPAPAPDDVVARVESGAILYAVASPEPEPPAVTFDPAAFDPYDWPTEAQLDEFIAKRDAGRADPR